MHCLCLHGDGPPECALLYKLTVVQLASPAFDIHTMSTQFPVHIIGKSILSSSPLLQT